KRKLIVFRVDTELHSGMRRKQQLEAGERIAHVRQCQVCAMPRATGANIVYRNVHRRRELLRKSMKELHHSFGIRNHVCGEIPIVLGEREGVHARAEALPYRGRRLSTSEKRHQCASELMEPMRPCR